jgi:crotonobetainyl-CoA:carnitine CoA-transferase CaiB-like acyl-CoA transferase
MEALDDAFTQGYYNTWNRNKLGITLDLNQPEGVALAKRLASVSDAVIENFSPWVMSNWGLDYAILKKIKPDIIMVSMSVMGRQSNYSGYGPTVHALSGMTYLTSFPGGPPVGPGFSFADHVAGLYASIGLLSALEKRRKTGKGQHIDISEVDAMSSLLVDINNSPVGNDSSLAAPHNVYKCKGDDRWCAVVAFTEEEWQGVKKALGNPAWTEDIKFSTLSRRLQNRDELDKRISAWTQQQNAAEVMALFQKNSVAAGVVQNAADLAQDVLLKKRDFIIENTGVPFVDATPIKMSTAKVEYKRTAPVPGQDNDYVYGKLLGISEQARKELKEKGVI